MKKILITSGPTRAPLDDVRYLTNHSTGTFGTHLADEALKTGAQVTFVYGVGSKMPPPQPNLNLIPIITHEDVSKTLQQQLMKQNFDLIIHAMAVLDFQPEEIAKGKTKTKDGTWHLQLVPTPKIINQIKKWSPQSVLIGFKLESGVDQQTLLTSARQLLKDSRADYVLANQLTEGTDEQHEGFLLERSGEIIAQAKGKQKLARLIVSLLK